MSRRHCLRQLGLGAAAVAAAPLSFCGPQRARTGVPNVVFILADDLGYGDLGCYGAPDLFTPHLDRLASSGLRFTQFYTTCPICTPSRVSFLTGRHFSRGIQPGLGMVSSEVTVAEMLRTGGYRTGLFGKWHLGIPPHVSPNAQGFDEFMGFKVGAIDNYSHYFYWGGAHRHCLFRNESPHREDGVYFPDLVTRECERFIAQSRDRPFFLYAAFNTPHYPLQPRARDLERYGGIQDPLRRLYAGCVTVLDDRVGRILAALDEHGLRDNTIVAFASDHGPSREERGGGGSAGPLRGAKDTLWEGGLRVPFLLSWPGVVPAGQVRHQPATCMDLLPTLAAYCGVARPDRPLDGVSLAPVIASDQAPPLHPVMNWVFREAWAVREGDWKLLGDGDARFLANLREDQGETRNRVGERPDLIQRLSAYHQRWMSQDLGLTPSEGRPAGPSPAGRQS